MSDVLKIQRDGCNIHNETWVPGQLELNDFAAVGSSHHSHVGSSPLVSEYPIDFPKYTTQLLNPANKFSQATRVDVVGDMNKLTRQFNTDNPNGDFVDWVDFYYNQRQGHQRIARAVERLMPMVEKMRSAFEQIDEEMCREFVRDLVLYKTYRGFDVEKMILDRLATKFSVDSKKSSSAEESDGIDGYLSGRPVQIKPQSYKNSVNGEHEIPVIFYKRDERRGVFLVDFSQISGML